MLLLAPCGRSAPKLPNDKKASNNFQKGECYTPAQQRITEGEFGTKLIDPTDKKVSR